MSLTTHLASVLLLAFFVSAGCSASEPDSGPPPALTRSEGCEKTNCQLSVEECSARVDLCFDTCLNGSLDTLLLCHDVCRGMDCPLCTDSGCAVRSYRFTVTGSENPDVKAACSAAVARDERCGESTVARDCSHAAKTERAEAELVYACVAGTTCGASIGRCREVLPKSDLGRVLCSHALTCGDGPCDVVSSAALDALGRWLRSEILAIGMSCLSEDCPDASNCIDAWITAVSPR